MAGNSPTETSLQSVSSAEQLNTSSGLRKKVGESPTKNQLGNTIHRPSTSTGGSHAARRRKRCARRIPKGNQEHQAPEVCQPHGYNRWHLALYEASGQKRMARDQADQLQSPALQLDQQEGWLADHHRSQLQECSSEIRARDENRGE